MTKMVTSAQCALLILCVCVVASLVSARTASATTCRPVTYWAIEFHSIEQVDDLELDEALLGDERRNWFTTSEFTQSYSDVPEWNILYGYAEPLLLRVREP